MSTVFTRAVSLTEEVLGEWGDTTLTVGKYSNLNATVASNIVRALAEAGLLIMDPVEDEDTSRQATQAWTARRSGADTMSMIVNDDEQELVMRLLRACRIVVTVEDREVIDLMLWRCDTTAYAGMILP